MTHDIDEQVVKAKKALAETRFTTYWLDSLNSVADEPALAQDAQCDLLGALRLYLRHGYKIVERLPMVASDYLPAGDVLLLTRAPVID